MSWSASGTTPEEVKENFDKNYPEPAVGVKEQFEAALNAATSLVESVSNSGDECSATVQKSGETISIAIRGHVSTVSAS